MLNENDVIRIVQAFLEADDWQIDRTSNTHQQGPDIEAVKRRPVSPCRFACAWGSVRAKQGRRLLVEAKGETSSKPGSVRYGQRFTRSQAFDHVAKAFHTAAAVTPPAISAIALPINKDHRHFMGQIRTALCTLRVAVFWVRECRVDNTWHWPP